MTDNQRAIALKLNIARHAALIARNEKRTDLVRYVNAVLALEAEARKARVI